MYMHGWMTGNLQKQRKEKMWKKSHTDCSQTFMNIKKKKKNQTNLLESHLEAHGDELEAMTLRKLGSSKL